MCGTCGCGEADVRLTHLGAPTSGHAHGARVTTTTTTTVTTVGRSSSSRTTTAHPHPRTSRSRCWRRTTSWPRANRALAGRARDHRPEPDELAGVGQDHPARDGPSPRSDRAGERDRGRPGDGVRRRADPRRRRPRGAGQHRRRLSPRCRDGGPRPDELAPEPDSIVFIENVGNLVCPALFDLGEARKVVVISVTEGDDKPLKYPHMFAAADLVVVNKTDLLPYVDFDLDRLARDARSINPTSRCCRCRRRPATTWTPGWPGSRASGGPGTVPLDKPRRQGSDESGRVTGVTQ